MAHKRKAKEPTLEIKPTFHERFNIQVGVDVAQRKFIHRVENQIFSELLEDEETLAYIANERIRRAVANALGERYQRMTNIASYIRHDFARVGDFHTCLQALESIHDTISSFGDVMKVRQLTAIINRILQTSEIDLGVTWENGIFVRSGAKLLDHALINEPLSWLSAPKYSNVYAPFEKGLKHFLQSEKRPEILSDVITDMYESLEALAKVISERPSKDLSANAELFVQRIKASEHYKRLLKDYITYANEFRHAGVEGRPRPKLTNNEVESFIYLTGIFIRVAITATGATEGAV